MKAEDVPFDVIEKRIRSYHEWLSIQLSKYGGVNIEEVFDALHFTGVAKED